MKLYVKSLKHYLEKIIKYIYAFIGILLMFIGTLIIFVVNKIEGKEGKPSKCKKDKSIGVFVVNYNKESGDRDCNEIARGKIGSKGDIYVLTNLKHQNKFPFYESFHKSGRHHWKEGNKCLYPLAFDGEGLPASEKFVNFVAKQPYCFCFRKGKRIKDEEIKPLVEKLIRYVPSINIEDAISALKKEGVFQARLKKEVIKTRQRILQKDHK